MNCKNRTSQKNAVSVQGIKGLFIALLAAFYQFEIHHCQPSCLVHHILSILQGKKGENKTEGRYNLPFHWGELWESNP